MNRAILYRPSGKWQTAAAFVCAAVIHVAAVGMSAGKSDPAPPTAFSPAEVEGIDETRDPAPPIDIPPPEPPMLPAVANDFPEESPQPVRRVTLSHRVVPQAPRSTTRAASFGTIKTLAIFAPRPEYPYEARRRGAVGSGVAILSVDVVTGSVVDARMSQAMGNPLLDQSTLSALRRWRFKPGTPSQVQVPITFTLTGASY